MLMLQRSRQIPMLPAGEDNYKKINTNKFNVISQLGLRSSIIGHSPRNVDVVSVQ